MFIEIKAKLRPFSLCPGIRCLIPHTSWEAEIFPTKVFLRNHETKVSKELCLPQSQKFLVMLDLERGKLLVNGSELPIKGRPLPPNKARLFLGCHKKQDWEMVQRRKELAEIFPFWVRLAQLIPEHPLPKESIGTMQLLERGELDAFFQAGFVGMLCPRFKDEHYLGLIDDVNPSATLNPLGLIHQGARLIEQLFFHSDGKTWQILPALPKELHAGRYVHLRTPEGDTVHLEWSKKQIKKMEIRPMATRGIELKLKKGLKSFRVRKSLRQRGERTAGSLSLQSGQTLYLDRFTAGH